MAQKWTEAQRAKFKRTMAEKAKNPITIKTLEEWPNPKDLPLRHIPNGEASDVEEFAKFMAAAWKVYKGG